MIRTPVGKAVSARHGRPNSRAAVALATFIIHGQPWIAARDLAASFADWYRLLRKARLRLDSAGRWDITDATHAWAARTVERNQRTPRHQPTHRTP